MSRAVLVLAYTERPVAVLRAREVAARLIAAGVGVRVLAGEAAALAVPSAQVVPEGVEAARGVDVVLVFGGDGSLLRAAELARPAAAPLLGVNLGRVGFLAEADPDTLEYTVGQIVDCDFEVEDRLTLDVTVTLDGQVSATGWALNEVAVEKAARERMLEVVVEIDGRPLSRWGCDGVLFATPTGSTAYAFSAGGPVVWPAVEALLLVPVSAHALFARPLVTAPSSVLAVEVLPGSSGAVLSADGRRTVTVPVGGRVEARRGAAPVRLARLRAEPFTDRLVTKFGLRVEGWRGRAGAEHLSTLDGVAAPNPPVPPNPPAAVARVAAADMGGIDRSGG
jgi:NAD+ kinase